MTRLLPLLACLALTGCQVLTGPRAIIASPGSQWRSVATGADRARLRDWRDAFVDALGKARASGHGAAIAAEGALLDPDAALGGAPIPNGDYRCRVIKLGASSPACSIMSLTRPSPAAFRPTDDIAASPRSTDRSARSA